MDSDRRLADAIVGKSARACDNCIKKRARWYCAADDAFLCQSCDSSVHSANSLSRRHQRVRLKSASSKSIQTESETSNWHQGFTRKARTPRQPHKKHGNSLLSSNPFLLVPQICSEDQHSNEEENEEQLLYRVPIFEPSVAELLITTPADINEVGAVKSSDLNGSFITQEVNDVERNILLPSDMDLEEFDVDVESLLGKGLEDYESFNNMEGLGLVDCDENGRELSSNELFWPSDERVKDEVVVANTSMMDDENYHHHHHQIDVEFDIGRETFELNFDYEYSPITGEEAEEEDYRTVDETEERNSMNNFEDFGIDECYNKSTFLKLDYGGVMSAWDEHKSPWTTGERPEFISGGLLPDSLGISGTMGVCGETGMTSGCVSLAAKGDGGREARVCRYREKRRKRLFSKKIRYEVRKLNAEKRPRMKGRFVKRSNLGVT